MRRSTQRAAAAPRIGLTGLPAPAPLVSFIMPARNHAAYVGTALNSVLAQSHPRIELIVIDDGSQDDTAGEIARTLASCRREMRIEFIRQQNQGLARTLIRGLDLARGDYVQFLASDDALFPDMTARLVARLRQAGPQVVAAACDGYVFDGHHSRHMLFSRLFPAPLSRNQHRELQVCNWFPAMGLLYRRDLMMEAGGPDPELVYEDWGLLLNLTRRLQIVQIPDRLFLYRQHNRNTSKDPVRMAAAHRELCERFPPMARARRLKQALLARDPRGILTGLSPGNLDLALRFALREGQKRLNKVAEGQALRPLWPGRTARSAVPAGAGGAVSLDVQARIGAGVRLLPGGGGRIEIGAGCVIGAGAVLIAGPGDLVLGPGCRIGPGACLVAGDGLTLGADCFVEAGARLGAGGAGGATRVGRAGLVAQDAVLCAGTILGDLSAVGPGVVVRGTHPAGAWLLRNDPGTIGETAPGEAAF